MRTAILISAALIITVMSGCIPSIHPIYNEDQMIIAPDLEGVWVSSDANETWQFTLLTQEKKYDLVFTDAEGRSGLFTSVLTEINGQLYLDMFPKPPPNSLNAYYTMHMVPAHTFMQINISETEVDLRVLDFNWLENYLIADPESISHEKTDQLPVLTAKTPELRAFIEKTMAIDGTWSEAVVLTKMELDQPTL